MQMCYIANLTVNFRTALHLACAKGAKEIISFLCGHLKSIIDVNLKDLNGCTPMHKVAMVILCNLLTFIILQLIDNGHGCNGSLEQLIECGGNLNLANEFGHTPLHLAARRGDAVTASFLVFKGASVHAMDQVSSQKEYVTYRAHVSKTTDH